MCWLTDREGDAQVEKVTEMSTPALLARIAHLQLIQKTHNHREPAWQVASNLLAPCFAEMARREPAPRTNQTLVIRRHS